MRVEAGERGAGKAGTVETAVDGTAQSGHGVGHEEGSRRSTFRNEANLDGGSFRSKTWTSAPARQVTDSGGTMPGATTSAHENPLAFVAPQARTFHRSPSPLLVVSVFRRFSAPQCGASAAHSAGPGQPKHDASVSTSSSVVSQEQGPRSPLNVVGSHAGRPPPWSTLGLFGRGIVGVITPRW